jgi:hypothetical protein
LVGEERRWVTTDRMESAEQYRKFAERCEEMARLRPELAAALLETAYLWREVAAAAQQIENTVKAAE